MSVMQDKPEIIETVSRYTDLRRAGREFIGLCPFHAEKTPSFSVNEEKGVFYCHGCHAGGDVITFVRKMEDVDFKAALRILGIDGRKAMPPAKLRRLKESREAARRIRDWARETSIRIEARLRDVGGRAHTARKILREMPDGADPDFLKEELERYRREWPILCDFHDDLFNADFAVEMWRIRDVIDAFVGEPDMEIPDRWPPLTKQ